VVLVTFTALTLQPLTAAAQLPSAPKRQLTLSDTGEERFSRTLNEIHEILKEVVPQAAMPHRPKGTTPTAAGKPGEKVLQAVGPKMRLESERAKPLPGVDVTARVKTLRGKYKELKSLESEVSKGFKETEKHIRDKNLPPEILARHEAAVAEYDKRRAEFGTLMAAVEAASDGKGELQTALSNLGDFMAKYPNAKTHTPTDPNNLPWGSPKPVTRAPYTSPAQFKTSRLFGETVKVAQAGSLSGIGLPSTVLPTTPMPADTAPTEDVQITQAIRDLAASLGNNPVKIYNWVRNNIQFVPSYGSIQGSDMTLQTKRGNSFDTASLLIALLRAANVPSRYVYGTIEVPADKAMNWVGGVTVPQAAQSLMGQGGIPNVGIGFAGQIRSIRLEHMWVEAFVDYVPSRGAVNRSPNTWVPLDASFKQYQFTQGLDIKANVPFDAQSFITQTQQGAVVNETEGWVQNANQTRVQQTLTNYQTQVTNYVNTQKPNATVGEVLGTQTIVQENRSILLGTLPYTRIATGAKVQVIPDNLRSYVTVALYSSSTAAALESADFSQRISLPSLGYKRFTLSYDPASSSDESVILANTTALSTLPAYLIRVKPVLRVAGQTVSIGGSVTLGTEQPWKLALEFPNVPPMNASNTVTAGSYVAIVPKLSRVTENTLAEIRSQLLSIQQAVSAGDFSNVSKDDVTGAMLYAAGLGYWAQEDLFSNIGAIAGKIRKVNAQHLGLFSWDMKIGYFFGLPRSATAGNLSTDIDIHRVAAIEQSNNGAKTAQYLMQQGMQASYLEGAHWEVFRDQHFTGKGISAASIIGKSAAAGMKIFSVSASNIDTVLPQLGVGIEVKEEIANAVAAGNAATIPQQNIQLDAWIGTGYVIADPSTGAAAYKISGGFNGGGFGCNCIGFDPTIEASVGLLLGLAAFAVSSPAVAVILGIIGLVLSVLSLIDTICQINQGNACNKDAVLFAAGLLGGIGIVLGLVGLFFGVLPIFLIFGLFVPILATFASAFMTTSLMQSLSCRLP